MSERGASPSSLGVLRQLEIYGGGLMGRRPALPVEIEALERAAIDALSTEAAGYLGGMTDTMRANLEAFRRWRIVPRLLRDVSHRDTGIELLGRRYPAPVLLAPIGVQSIMHPDGEIGVARAAAAVGVPMVISSASHAPLEAVTDVMGDAPRWFQLYWGKDDSFTQSVLRRAATAGCEAIVLTLDTYHIAWRPADLQNAYLPFLLGHGIGTYLSDPAFCAGLERSPEDDPRAAIQRFLQISTNPSLTWADLAKLRAWTSLPILVKGLLHPDDARLAVEAGVDGIVVSNHGGRQVEGAIAALDALPAIVEAVAGHMPILFDSGVRTASDVIKAVALGASAVLLGRPVMWALALGGEAGVSELLANFMADLDLTLALSGYRGFGEINKETVQRQPV